MWQRSSEEEEDRAAGIATHKASWIWPFRVALSQTHTVPGAAGSTNALSPYPPAVVEYPRARDPACLGAASAAYASIDAFVRDVVAGPVVLTLDHARGRHPTSQLTYEFNITVDQHNKVYQLRTSVDWGSIRPSDSRTTIAETRLSRIATADTYPSFMLYLVDQVTGAPLGAEAMRDIKINTHSVHRQRSESITFMSPVSMTVYVFGPAAAFDGVVAGIVTTKFNDAFCRVALRAAMGMPDEAMLPNEDPAAPFACGLGFGSNSGGESMSAGEGDGEECEDVRSSPGRVVRRRAMTCGV